ncbi:hypothetical protein KJS94_15030 [Flavihumibacter rivuli]|uniref:hypothetical protein n=1 Tax=Flavihumibacter rivuli TaxID=2838156 RepID=UPI001BDEAC6D|nr:hypothetical protein [Flavihumibacter rivuli]ULQ55962.1 hypothetical protein KJS94_15030 [Flavihumibacter rivuli]
MIERDFQETENTGLKTHLDCLHQYFNFLLTDYGFHLKSNGFHGREFWTIYTNMIIDIKIMFESSSELPWVYIEQCNKQDNYLVISAYSNIMKSILQTQKDRIEPLLSKYLSNNYDSTELEKDYISFGQYEHREYMKEAAITLKDILENKSTAIKLL